MVDWLDREFDNSKGDKMMDYETFKKSWDEEHSIKCPYCGEDYTNDSEFKEDLVTYHAEEPPQEKECGNCEKKFYVQEVVDRTWEVGTVIISAPEIATAIIQSFGQEKEG